MTNARRASNGRSSVYRGKDGSWHGRVTMGVKDDGRPDRRHVRGRTEGEVTRKVQQLERQRDKGHAANAGRPPTVEQWMTTYLETVAARTLAPRSLDDYWSKTRNWIIPKIGQHRLDRLQPEHLDRLYASMAAAGKAPSHIVKVHRIISRALEIAVRRGKVGRNVAKLVDTPPISATEVRPFTRDEAKRILTAAEDMHNGARWSVGLALGLRQGEALGLRWTYVDLEQGMVRVWWQLQRQKGRGLVFREPKGRSRRVVRCPPNYCTTSERTARLNSPNGSPAVRRGRRMISSSVSQTECRSTPVGTGPTGRHCSHQPGSATVACMTRDTRRARS
jgi:integrase